MHVSPTLVFLCELCLRSGSTASCQEDSYDPGANIRGRHPDVKTSPELNSHCPSLNKSKKNTWPSLQNPRPLKTEPFEQKKPPQTLHNFSCHAKPTNPDDEGSWLRPHSHIVPLGSSYLNSRLLGYIIYGYLGNWSPRGFQANSVIEIGT